MVNFRQLPLIVLVTLSLTGFVSAKPEMSADDQMSAQCHHSKKEHCDRHNSGEKPDHLLSNCAYSKSVHNYVSYIPFVGPFFDLSTIDSNVQLKWWEVPLSVALPVFGTGITRTLGTRVCVDDAAHGKCHHGGEHEKMCEKGKHEHCL